MEFLSQKGIDYTERDISQDPSAVDELVAMNSTSTPTIKVDDQVMIGFRKDQLLEWLEEA